MGRLMPIESRSARQPGDMPNIEHSRQICRGVILMFHEVHDDAHYACELDAGCTVSLLESVIGYLRREQWDLVTIGEAVSRLHDDNPGRPFAVLTFDDGYRDTLIRALPVLERHRAPFVVYIVAGAPTAALHSWWLGVRALVQTQDEITISAMNATFDCRSAGSKILAHDMVCQWVHEDFDRARRLDETFRSYNVSLEALNRVYFMSEKELYALASNPLATIGAHSTSHAPLTKLDAHAVRQEMVGSRAYLEDLVDRPVLDFAYPYGASADREFILAAAAGFRSAVTTRYDGVFAAHRMIAHQLPRIGVAGTVADFDRFAAGMQRLRDLSVAPRFP